MSISETIEAEVLRDAIAGLPDSHLSDLWLFTCDTPGCKYHAAVFRPDGASLTKARSDSIGRANGWLCLGDADYCPEHNPRTEDSK